MIERNRELVEDNKELQRKIDHLQNTTQQQTAMQDYEELLKQRDLSV